MHIEKTIKVIFGAIILAVGLILIFTIRIIGWIYGPILIIIGLAFVIFSKSENQIEQRKDIKNKEDN